ISEVSAVKPIRSLHFSIVEQYEMAPVPDALQSRGRANVPFSTLRTFQRSDAVLASYTYSEPSLHPVRASCLSGYPNLRQSEWRTPSLHHQTDETTRLDPPGYHQPYRLHSVVNYFSEIESFDAPTLSVDRQSCCPMQQDS